MRIVTFLLVWISICGVTSELLSQKDSIHWIPPMHARNEPGPQYLYLSTPETQPITIEIRDGSGNIITDCTGNAIGNITISNSNPATICIGLTQGTALLVPGQDLHRPLQNRGLVLKSSYPFYANLRVRSFNEFQAGSLTAKGTRGAGKIFRIGHVFANVDPTNHKCHFIGMMATEDSTEINLNDYPAGVEFAGAGNDLGTIWLDKGECYVASVYLIATLPDNDNGLMGALLESSKPIVVNIGSWTGSPNGANRDVGIDQIVPLEVVGEEYVLVKGRGPASLETPIVVAHYNNTQVYINGGAIPVMILQAGDFYRIPNSYYSNNENMYVRCSQPVYMYQMVGGNFDPRTGGLNFVPPFSCLGEKVIDNIPDIAAVGTRIYNGGLFLTTQRAAQVLINGAPPNAPARVVPGKIDYVTYKIDSGLSGNVSVISDKPVQVGFFGFAGVSGYGGYYSGFENYRTELTFDNLICPDTLFSSSLGLNVFQWYKDGSPIPGEDRDFLPVHEPGEYYLIASNTDCNEISDTTAIFTIQAPDTSHVENYTCLPQEAGWVMDTLTTIDGCDSIVITETFLNPSDSIYNEFASCHPADTGFFVSVYSNQYGCDSIHYDQVNLLPSHQENYYVNTCNPAAAGIDTAILTNQNGCDSLIITETTLQESYESTMEKYICRGESLQFGEYTITEPGIYFDSLQTIYGCDSVIILDLTVYETYQEERNIQRCEGEAFLFLGDSLRETGTYTYELTTTEGCDSIINIHLDVTPLPDIAIDGVEPFCAGDSIQLSALSGEDNFLWSTGSKEPDLTVQTGGPYTVTVTDAFNCQNTATVIVPDPAEVTANTHTVDINCYNEQTGEIHILNKDGGYPPYKIQLNGVSYDQWEMTGLPAGSYHLIIEDSISCQWQDTLVLSQPTDSFRVWLGNDTLVDYGDYLTLHARLNEPSYKIIRWTPSDFLNCSQCLNPWLQAFDDIQFTIRVQNERGCLATDHQWIRVNRTPTLYIPNAFSPNGDGRNDYFTLYGNAFTDQIADLRIYTRWGELVFQAKNIPHGVEPYGWDGIFKGKRMNPGVYVYYAEVLFHNGLIKSYKGDITLIR